MLERISPENIKDRTLAELTALCDELRATICDTVGKFDNHALQCGCHAFTRVVDDRITHFPCQIQALSAVFQFFDHAQALLVVRKILGKKLLHSVLT